MGHDKLRKFAENETFSCLLQPSASELLADGFFALRDHAVKGRWNEDMFDAARPLVLELGCGKGEYTIDLSRREPSCNYIGVDIKGARLWKGAKYAHEHQLGNVAFLRTRIEFIGAFFAPDEVSQIWLTFSDPQLKSENSRLTSPVFLERYRRFLRPGGIVHLKTDSRFLYEYSCSRRRMWRRCTRCRRSTSGCSARRGTRSLTWRSRWTTTGRSGILPRPSSMRRTGGASRGRGILPRRRIPSNSFSLRCRTSG